jgi:hypothetical protein
MPTPPGFGDVSIKLQHVLMPRPAYVTFGVDPVDTDPILVADAIRLAWLASGSLNSKMDASVTASEYIVRLGTDGGEDVIGSVTSTTGGGVTQTSTTPNVAALVHKRTARGGRRGRGRMFLPWFLSTSQCDEAGVITPAIVSALQTAAAVFNGELTTRGTPMVVLHNTGKTSMGAPDRVTSMQVSGLVATQRRRLGR